MGDVDLFFVLYSEGSKKRWHSVQNRANPSYDDWVTDPDADGPRPPMRLVSNVSSARGFELGVFRALGTQAERLEYLRGTSMWLGSGSSRVVFAVTPKRVVKLAGGSRLDTGGHDTPEWRMTEAGMGQNRHEFEVWERVGSDEVVGLLPRCFEIAEDSSWLLAELVRPLDGEGELREMFGLDDDDMHRLLVVLGEHRHMNSEYFKNFVLGLREKIDDPEVDSDVREGTKRGLGLVLMIHRLKELDPGLSLVELDDPSAWGKGADGRLVLLDYGADETLIKRYYDE